MKRVSVYLKLIIALLLFLLLAFFVHGQGKNDLADKTLTVTSFVFGIILAFSISNRSFRLGKIREKLREQDAKLLEIYYLSKKLGAKNTALIKKEIDSFLMNQIDYRLSDFNKEATQKVKHFFLFIENLKISPKQEKNRDSILKLLEDILEIDKEVSYHLDNKMAFYEWLSLGTLAGVIFFILIFYFNTNTLVSVVLISVVCTALCLLLFVLADLNKLEWQEQNWIWKPLTNLFIELDLVPYYPSALFEQGRLSFKVIRSWDKVTKIRLAKYPNPYPDISGKKIETLKI